MNPEGSARNSLKIAGICSHAELTSRAAVIG